MFTGTPQFLLHSVVKIIFLEHNQDDMLTASKHLLFLSSVLGVHSFIWNILWAPFICKLLLWVLEIQQETNQTKLFSLWGLHFIGETDSKWIIKYIVYYIVIKLWRKTFEKRWEVPCYSRQERFLWQGNIWAAAWRK